MLRHQLLIIIIIIIILLETNIRNNYNNSNRPCSIVHLSDRWVRAPKCSRHAEGVAALNCHRETLTKKRCCMWFVGHSCQSAADFHDEVKGLLAPGSRCLDRKRNEIDVSCDYYYCLLLLLLLLLLVVVVVVQHKTEKTNTKPTLDTVRHSSLTRVAIIILLLLVRWIKILQSL